MDTIPQSNTLELSKIILPLVGTLIGGLIALLAIWIKERADRQREIQTWFEQYYITEGLDLIIKIFILVRLRLMREKKQALDSAIASISFPIDAVAKLSTIFPSKQAFAVAVVFYDFLIFPEEVFKPISKENKEEVLLTLQHSLGTLQLLREELLGLRIKKKSDIYKIPRNEKISKLIDALDNSSN